MDGLESWKIKFLRKIPKNGWFIRWSHPSFWDDGSTYRLAMAQPFFPVGFCTFSASTGLYFGSKPSESDVFHSNHGFPGVFFCCNKSPFCCFFFQGWIYIHGFWGFFVWFLFRMFLLIVRTESRNGADLSLEVVKKSEPCGWAKWLSEISSKCISWNGSLTITSFCLEVHRARLHMAGRVKMANM